MKASLAMKALVLSIAAGAMAVASALTAGQLLRRSAVRDSHQLATPDVWFEPATVTSPALVASGRKLFLNNCAHCHGFDATGDEGPDLHQVPVSDRYIVHLINQGLPHEMPAFRAKFSAADVNALLAYVRSLE